MKHFLLPVFILLFATMLKSQPQWRFHVAFEDATGAKDTLWMIYDTTATFGIDTTHGEGRVNLNHSQFNVWILNNNFDSTKTQALPYTNYPNHALWSIGAINYQYPIIITWDTSLFHAPFLPTHGTVGTAKIYNDYFWGVNNDPPLQAYNMLIDNHAIAPSFNWGAREHFPMDVILYQSTISVKSLNFTHNGNIFPNPIGDVFFINTNLEIEKVVILNLIGKCLKLIENPSSNSSYSYNVSDLVPGTYAVKVFYTHNKVTYHIIIKI